jgi:hypothetical protein
LTSRFFHEDNRSVCPSRGSPTARGRSAAARAGARGSQPIRPPSELRIAHGE